MSKALRRIVLVNFIILLAILACSIGPYNIERDDDSSDSDETDKRDESSDPAKTPRVTRTERPTKTPRTGPSNTSEPILVYTATIKPTETPSGPFEYIVVSGDTFAGIALQFGVTVESILEINGLSNNYIYEGQVLLIPQPSTGSPLGPIEYVVKSGDTCATIAAAFGVSIQNIIWTSNLSGDCIIYEGQTLLITRPTPTVTP